MAKSIEPNVVEYCSNILSSLGIRYCREQESLNSEIDEALASAPSKSGGKGKNRPDRYFMIDDGHSRYIPVFIEAKGTAGKLEALDDEGIPDMKISKGSATSNKIQQNAVNGAVHYANAVLKYPNSTYNEVIAVGINGSMLDFNGNVTDFEVSAWYISQKNHLVPKRIKKIDNTFIMFAERNRKGLYAELDNLLLDDAQLEKIKLDMENTLEERVKEIHQKIYDDGDIALGTNDKLYLFCGLIMAGLPADNVKQLNIDEFNGNDDISDNDGQLILRHINSFLNKKNCSQEKIDTINDCIHGVFENESLWKPYNGESKLKTLFAAVKQSIIPCLIDQDIRLDFTGKILNSLNDWVQIENDKKNNDVVLTPRYITTFMAHLAQTNRNSYVWDRAMGSGGFLVSAMDIMIRDAKEHIKDKDELDEKINHIKSKQLFGVEILPNIYILSILNMILMGDGTSNLVKGDSHKPGICDGFNANVFLLNPPYSAPGKGFNFVEETLKDMANGYACVLIQENAGSGQGLPYTKRILENNSLIASIKMPKELFLGKSKVATAIYLFQVGRPHEEDDLVKFIDMSEDGYTRMNRSKSSQAVNLRDTNNAPAHYAEVEARVLGKKTETEYYTNENGLYIEDTISLEGNDWTYLQHKVIDPMPTENDFMKTVSDYMSWELGVILRGKDNE